MKGGERMKRRGKTQVADVGRQSRKEDVRKKGINASKEEVCIKLDEEGLNNG